MMASYVQHAKVAATLRRCRPTIMLAPSLSLRTMSSAATTAAAAASSIRQSAASSSSMMASRRRAMGSSTVRVILTNDLPDGRGYAGEVHRVKAGYARNHLVPLKKALYATPKNFERVGVSDPDAETQEERREREKREAEARGGDGEDYQKSADFLRHYLRNKVLKIWRNVDPNTGTVHPGMVDHLAVRQKLSKQLKIDLDEHEKLHILSKPVLPSHADVSDDDLDGMLVDVGTPDEEGGDGGDGGDGAECTVQLRQLGDYVAKISLAGGHGVPLRFVVLKR